MTAATRRRLEVPGPLGWVGAALMLAGVACQMLSVFLLLLLVVRKDTQLVLPAIVAFLGSLLLIVSGGGFWMIGLKRTGRMRPSSMPKDRRAALIRALAF